MLLKFIFMKHILVAIYIESVCFMKKHSKPNVNFVILFLIKILFELKVHPVI